MKGSLKRRWVVPTAALLISLTIGATAWAATDATTGSTDSAGSSGTAEATVPEPGFGDFVFGGGGPHGGGMRGGPGGRGGADLTDEQKQALEERRQEIEARRDAMMDLLRDKMSAEDQAEFDQLRSTAEQQQATLEQARDALQATVQQIRALTDEYLDAAVSSGDESSGATSSTSTSDTSTSGASTTVAPAVITGGDSI